MNVVTMVKLCCSGLVIAARSFEREMVVYVVFLRSSSEYPIFFSAQGPGFQISDSPRNQSSVCVVPVSVTAPVRCAVHCADNWIPQTAWAILSHRQQTVSFKINNRWLPWFRLMCSYTRAARCGKEGCVAWANEHLTKPQNRGTKTDNDTTECLR